jgi:hypothetical protein
MHACDYEYHVNISCYVYTKWASVYSWNILFEINIYLFIYLFMCMNQQFMEWY